VAVSRRATSLPLEPDPDPAWNPATNPALTALLDHLAAELAQEYIRLMELAAQNDAATSTPLEPPESGQEVL
jgi:hypothetical protein